MTGTTEALAPIPPRTRRLFLTVVGGSDDGISAPVDDEITVGTSALADLTLSDRTVSRRHLIAEPYELGVRIRDAGSRNGTWVSSTRIFDAELTEGAELRIGSTILRVTRGSIDSGGTSPTSADSTSADSTHDEPSSTEASSTEASSTEASSTEASSTEASSVSSHRPSEGAQEAFGSFLGTSPALSRLYRELRRAAPTDVTVLIEGESGTGKELVAEALHENSARSSGPFIVVDCGAIPENLIESELFGHVRGSFTGATHDRAGAFEQANRGTLFLDELGELPLAMQTRLLRVLDRREVRRLGSNHVNTVDVRVIAATNRNLEREVEDGRFRPDLFHRLAVILVRIPPLRRRKDDIPLLARHFLRELGQQATLQRDVLARMESHPWPGNVRELRNYIERVAIFGEEVAALGTANVGVAQPTMVEGRAASTDANVNCAARDPETDDPRAPAWVGAIPSGDMPYRQARALAIRAFTDAYVKEMLDRHGGNVSQAARAAGIARRYFQRLKKDPPE